MPVGVNMRKTLFIDIETYCDLSIKRTNVYRYTEHPSFRIIMASWALDDSPITVFTDEDDTYNIPCLWDPDVVKVAHNAPFERICFSRFYGMDTGTYLPPEHWHDTLAVAAELGYPRSLSSLALALGADPKDEAGTRLINYFCSPNRKGKRNLPSSAPEEWEAFKQYNVQDVDTLRQVDLALGDWPSEHERRVYLTDQRINDYGVALDTDLAYYAEEAAADNRMVQELEISGKTGILNPSSGPQMLEWLRGPGRLPLPNLQKETVAKALARDNLLPLTRHVLEIRQDLVLVASNKYTAARAHVNEDGRLRGQFRFFGAHTGRWAGVGVQLHNLPRAQMESDVEAAAAILDLKMGNGADADTLKRLVRGMLVGPFTVVDYSAIEARVVAWLAGEEWALEAFRAGRDIYVETAQRMGGLTRFQGKVAVLALGYNGGVNSLRAMGYGGDKAAAVDRRRRGEQDPNLTDEEIQPLVDAWRGTNPNIVSMWKEMEVAFRRGGEVGSGLITVEVHGGDRAIRLPSGRAIWYRNCKWERKRNRFGNMSVQATFTDPKMPRFRADTYGGRLIENVTQAVARDVLASSLVRLQDAGLTPVGHVHDEILVEGEHGVDYIRSLMIKDPGWAAGLPLNGEGFTCARYRKG